MEYGSKLSCRVEKENHDLMKLLCRNRREYVSDFIRRAVRRELERISNPPGNDRGALDIGERMK